MSTQVEHDTSSHDHHHGHHHEMPTSGRALWNVSLSATLHCLTGCAIGEIAGMAIGTAAGFSNGSTVVLSIALAFFFGYALTSLPLLRAGLALTAVVPIALASDTLSIATMEVIDNVIMVTIPGAMDAGLGSLLFWGSLGFALVVAGAVAVPVNRYLIARGKGHAVVHETGIHGGPPVRLVGAVAAVAFVFGSTVLVAEAIDGSGMGHGGHAEMAAGHGGHGGAGGEEAAPVRGLSTVENGVTLSLARTSLPTGRAEDLTFRIEDANGRAVKDFEVEHERRMHFIVVRRDLTNFQHLHPTLARDGTWHARLALPQPGSYRVFADFKRQGTVQTLGADLVADGRVDWSALPEPATTAATGDGYSVKVNGTSSPAGREAELRFDITRNGKPVRVEPYLGAGGHLVALREGDLAYLHVHPTTGAADEAVRFMTQFPSAGRYRLFLQFKHNGSVHTAAFTREAAR